ncbi:MAG: Rieske 2Fe-2S domain-containing protein [Chitinophagaceae bacterium]|nr:Rieske 2Fe-2S domain-containing protein [Chitinophagaceae bacterium]
MTNDINYTNEKALSQAKQYTWYKIADNTAELLQDGNGIIEVTAGDKIICIIKHSNRWFGCAAKCPHAGGTMADGYVDALGNIVCPLHRYKFSLTNGRNTSGEGYFLKTFPIELREDGVFAGIEQNNLFNWLK